MTLIEFQYVNGRKVLINFNAIKHIEPYHLDPSQTVIYFDEEYNIRLDHSYDDVFAIIYESTEIEIAFL